MLHGSTGGRTVQQYGESKAQGTPVAGGLVNIKGMTMNKALAARRLTQGLLYTREAKKSSILYGCGLQKGAAMGLPVRRGDGRLRCDAEDEAMAAKASFYEQLASFIATQALASEDVRRGIARLERVDRRGSAHRAMGGR